VVLRQAALHDSGTTRVDTCRSPQSPEQTEPVERKRRESRRERERDGRVGERERE
jgi:hypothetical protein